jgi:preprotein translocase subunit SecA
VQALSPLNWWSQVRLARWRLLANQIDSRSSEWQGLDDEELRRHSRELRWKAKSGVPLKKLLPEAFGLAREAARRTTGMTPYLVQLMGGMAMFEGGIAEMQTGEGKTLTAVLSAYLRALAGKGCHIVTVNDYLAARDAEEMGPIYEALDLTVGCIQTPMETDERRAAYSCDITYGTAKEMGFDFLRDQLRKGIARGAIDRSGLLETEPGSAPAEAAAQRGHHFALIDEADSVLIDEARTPLIIGMTQPNDPGSVSLFRWCYRTAAKLEPDVDFLYEPHRRTAFLTDTGCRRIVLTSKPSLISSIDSERIYRHIEQAVTAGLAYQKDRDYVIVEDEIVIVDESTGRIMDGRKWQDGLHQSIEAKEQVPITATSGEAARVTIQSFFRRYSHLAGMSGTAVQAARELKKIYGMNVAAVPTHRPCIRTGLAPRIYLNADDKREAVVSEIAELVQNDRAVLVGTPSVDASEALAARLESLGIDHRILNATRHESEAEVVAEAGQSRRVTVATNMAGRGTDIKLSDELTTAGGLHVIATEMHSSARIDRQLVGRAARQGDPGSYQFFLSLEDELLRCRGVRELENLREQARSGDSGSLALSWISFFRKTQKMLERQHRKERRELLKHEKQRNDNYKRMGLDPCLELTES